MTSLNFVREQVQEEKNKINAPISNDICHLLTETFIKHLEKQLNDNNSKIIKEIIDSKINNKIIGVQSTDITTIEPMELLKVSNKCPNFRSEVNQYFKSKYGENIQIGNLNPSFLNKGEVYIVLEL